MLKRDKMAYQVRLIYANHPTGSMILKESGQKKIVITKDWKSVANKTPKLMEWEKKGFIAVKRFDKKETEKKKTVKTTTKKK
jgi:hypothetical protein